MLDLVEPGESAFVESVLWAYDMVADVVAFVTYYDVMAVVLAVSEVVVGVIFVVAAVVVGA